MVKLLCFIFAPIFVPLAWFCKCMSPFEITCSKPCLDDKQAERYKADAVVYIPDDRLMYKGYKNPDADGQPQRMYMFFVNKPKQLLNPDDDIVQYIYNYFYNLDIEVRGISVRQPNGDWKYIPFFIDQ